MRAEAFNAVAAFASSRAVAAISRAFDGGGSSSVLADIETVWPHAVAIGETVVFRSLLYRVVRSAVRRVACDDPAIFGSHLDGAEGTMGALVGLVLVAPPDRE